MEDRIRKMPEKALDIAVFYVCGVFAVYLRGLRLRRTLTAENLVGLCAAFGYMVSAAVGNTMWYTAPFAFILLGLGYGRKSE